MSKRTIENATSISDLASEDIIDTRNLDKLLDALEDRAAWEPEDEQTADDNPDPLDDDEQELLKLLRELKDKVSEWRYGETLISEHYWKEYARQLADDLGYCGKEFGNNPLSSCIDWDKWADELGSDYTCTEIGGTTFYYRNC